MKIKTIRRIETEIDNELQFLSSRMGRDNNQSTKEAAEIAGVEVVTHALKAYTRLIGAKFEIRNLIAEFNSGKGINAKTSLIAQLESEKDFLENSALRVGRARATRSYGTDAAEYCIGIPDSFEDEIRALIRGATRKIQTLKDSCNGINSQGDIEISDSLLSVFTDYSLVD